VIGLSYGIKDDGFVRGRWLEEGSLDLAALCVYPVVISKRRTGRATQLQHWIEQDGAETKGSERRTEATQSYSFVGIPGNDEPRDHGVIARINPEPGRNVEVL